MNTDTSEAIVSRLARLARLQFSTEEMEHYATEFSDIVAYVDQIEAVQATSHNDTDTIINNEPQSVSELRDDIVTSSDLADELLAQAPNRGGQDNRLVKVPSVFDRSNASSV